MITTSSSDLESSCLVIDIDEETIARAEAEQQNEIIVLNFTTDSWKLDVGDAFHRQREEIQDKLKTAMTEEPDQDFVDSDIPSTTDPLSLLEDKVCVVSLLGNTSSGKSFIARCLLTDSYLEDLTGGPTIIDEFEKEGATTANVNCYVKSSAKSNKALVLDYEGEKGARFPLLLFARRRLVHLARLTEKAQHRRQAVTDYFPKLAYILSDIVILIGNDDLASTDYLARCQEFALKANDGVSQMVRRPLLIIIQNKGSLTLSDESSVVTQKFFRIHGEEAQALKTFFSDIKCYCLPHTGQSQSTKKGNLVGREIFHQQMVSLKKLLATVQYENYQQSLTHAQWLHLVQRVLTIVQDGKTVSLHILLNEIVDHNNDKTIQILISCFLRLYNEISIHSPIWFADCYRFAVRVLAHCLAVKAHGQTELMSEQIIREWCGKTLQQLHARLIEYQPCEALYTGKGRSSKEKDDEHKVYCYQHRGAHEGGHRTCQSVYGLTRWKEFWDWPSTDVWPGEFDLSTNRENHIESPSKDTIDDLLKMVRQLMGEFHQDPETIYHTFVSLFRHWCSKRPVEIFSCICFCALNSNCLQNKSPHQKRRRRRHSLLVMQYQLLTRQFDSNDCDSAECQACYQKLYDAWDKPHNFIIHPSAPTFAQADSGVNKPAKDSNSTRDSPLAPAGYRDFGNSYAKSALLDEQK